MNLEDVLNEAKIPRVEATDSLKKAAKVIYEGGVWAALALDDQGRVSYMITKTDIVKAISKGEDLEISAVEDYGTPSPLKLSKDKDLISTLRLLKEYKISHVLVTENDRLKGVVYIKDIVFALIDFIPSGKVVLGQISKRVPRLDDNATVADVATEIINMDTEAAFVGPNLVSDEEIVRSAAYGDPYSEPASKYSIERIITTDPMTDLECAVRLMKSNNATKLIVWKGKLASVKDVGYVMPEVIRELTRYVLLVRDGDVDGLEGLQDVKVIKTLGQFKAVIFVEGEDALKNLSKRHLRGDVIVLVELP